ncbi:hypothetical protein SFRURICE_020669 [Spodoptera frugiperda]|nr:hypothetical protein SFRURICE_020669 [Spodoptera frugiperda]
MKLKISTLKEPKHTGVVVCVNWNNTEDVFSCGDDHKLLKWNLVNSECIVVTTFPDDFFPNDMHLFPKISVGGNKHQHDVILISTADGKFHIVNHNGRIEKSVNAHQGACLIAQWSPDGAGLLTAGEDGFVKVWSRNGLLRSTIVQSDVPCFSAVWSPDSSAILHTKGNSLVIKQLNSSNKITKWKAHEGLILCVAWNANNNLILSGSEDGYSKIWDTFGQQISVSVKHDQPITSVSWSPAGDMFVLGSYNLIRLCNSNGWSHCLDRPTTGSIYNIAWSSDGTQLAAACANGHVLFAHIIDREYTWKNYACNQVGRKVIAIRDIMTDQNDQLDYPDRVIQIALGFNHLVTATVKQCFIHKLTSWNTPVTFDLKEGTISMILLAERCLCIVERAGLSVYSYMGRLLASPRWGARPESLGRAAVSLGPDALAAIDQGDRKLIHIFDLPTGLIVRSSADNAVTKLSHKMTVSSIALSQTGPINERQLALLDYNRDLYVVTFKDSKPKFVKLGSQILSICWSYETELLVGLRASSVVAWCCPRAAMQPDWLALTTVSKDVVGNGSILHLSIAAFPEKLLKHVVANMWQAALQLCRTVEDETLWACLAVLAWQHHQLPVAEEAFALIRQYHQVCYIQHLRMGALKVEVVLLLNLLLVSGDVYNNEVSEHSLELTQSLNLARQELIQETCRHFPPKHGLDELPPSQLEHILINEEHKLLYCYVPKVACTNWKRILMMLSGKWNGTDVLSITASIAHTPGLFRDLSNVSKAERDYMLENYNKMIIVRNPFERLLSAFRNKLEGDTLSARYFQDRIGRRIIKAYRENPSNESLEYGRDVTFKEFALFLTNRSEEMADVVNNEHWQPITNLCHPCLIKYTLVENTDVHLP